MSWYTLATSPRSAEPYPSPALLSKLSPRTAGAADLCKRHRAHVPHLDHEQAERALEHYYRRTGQDQKSVQENAYHSPRLSEKGEVVHAAPRLLHRSAGPGGEEQMMRQHHFYPHLRSFSPISSPREQMIAPRHRKTPHRISPPPARSSSPIASPKHLVYTSPGSPLNSKYVTSRGSVVVQGNVSYFQASPNSRHDPALIVHKFPGAQGSLAYASDFSEYLDVSSSQVSLSLVFKC